MQYCSENDQPPDKIDYSLTVDIIMPIHTS